MAVSKKKRQSSRRTCAERRNLKLMTKQAQSIQRAGFWAERLKSMQIRPKKA